MTKADLTTTMEPHSGRNSQKDDDYQCNQCREDRGGKDEREKDRDPADERMARRTVMCRLTVELSGAAAVV